MSYRVRYYETDELLLEGKCKYASSNNTVENLEVAISLANGSVGEVGTAIVIGDTEGVVYVKTNGRYIRSLFKNEEKELARRLSVIVTKLKSMGYICNGIITEIDDVIYLSVDSSLNIKMSTEGEIISASINKLKVDLKGDIEILSRYFKSFICNLKTFPILLETIHFHGEESLYKINAEYRVDIDGLTVKFD